MPEQPRRIRVSAVALAATALAGLAACTDDTSDPPPAPAPSRTATTEPTQGPDLSPAEQRAVEGARAKFDEFMNAYIEVSTADVPTAKNAEDLFYQVDQHLAGTLSQDLRGEIVGRWTRQQTAEGTLEWTFDEVIGVDLERRVEGRNIPRVNVQYCVDATNWVAVDNTGAQVGEPGVRRLVNYAVSWSDDWFDQGIEGWLIVGRTERSHQPC